MTGEKDLRYSDCVASCVDPCVGEEERKWVEWEAFLSAATVTSVLFRNREVGARVGCGAGWEGVGGGWLMRHDGDATAETWTYCCSLFEVVDPI